MDRNEITRYTLANPPSKVQFQMMGQFLAGELAVKLGKPVEVLGEHIEQYCWVTMTLFIGERDNLLNSCFFGIVSYSLRKETPSIESVLLKFEHGNRVNDGHKTILVSTFGKVGWKDFVWNEDIYGEWECDHVSDINLPKYGK